MRWYVIHALSGYEEKVVQTIKHLEARKEVLHAVADHSKVARVFDYRAKWSLEDGLVEVLIHARHPPPERTPDIALAIGRVEGKEQSLRPSLQKSAFLPHLRCPQQRGGQIADASSLGHTELDASFSQVRLCPLGLPQRLTHLFV